MKWGIAAALFGLTVLLFAPVTGFDFLTIDDNSYVYANPHVRPGLSWDGVRWAFLTPSYSSNWHPLTWLSHMLDSQLFRMRPGAHHATSMVLHAATGALLFLALRALGLRTWGAALVGALFAWHPLRAESVAWVAERKDVLAGLFLALTLLAWARHAARPSVPRYLLVATTFALGLLAKPMLVTLPLLLLLLDVWPLGRSRLVAGTPPRPPEQRRSLAWLALEKLPLLALSVASGVVTVLAQAKGGAVRPLIQLSLEDRISNAFTSVWTYVGKTLWPSDLATFYPHPAIVTPAAFEPWRAGVLLALAALVVVTALALLAVRRAPWLLVGWLWFLGMLVPVIGVVQVGEQAWADRYTYLPTIGLGIVLAGGLGVLLASRPALRAPVVAAACIALLFLGVRTRSALEPWRDTESLFRHALAVTERNYVAHYNLGVTYEAAGRLDEARRQYEATLAIKPDASDAHYNLGVLLLGQGLHAEAAEHLESAIALRPQRVHAYVNRGIALAELGRTAEAEEVLRRALELKPDSAEAWSNLGALSAQAGDFARARERYENALARDPERIAARFQLGIVLFRLGDLRAAETAFRETLRRDPEHGGARQWLSATRARLEQGGRDGE